MSPQLNLRSGLKRRNGLAVGADEKLTVLLLANYGAEVAEAGGALARNVQLGGVSHAAVFLCRPMWRPQVAKAGEVLGAEVRFLDFDYGEIGLTHEAKVKVIRAIRETKPDIVIMQDPESVLHHLDPDRRVTVLLCLEALALAGRDFALGEMPGLEPHPVPTIYYMWPERPNCVVDIGPVWHLKEKAFAELAFQMTYSAQYLARRLSPERLEAVIPGYDQLASDYERGLAFHILSEKSAAVRASLGSHGHFALAEPYRREGLFHLERLGP